MQSNPLFGATAPLLGLLETLPCAVSLLDRDFVIVAVNARWERVFGASRDEVVGQSYFDWFDRSALPFWENALRGNVNHTDGIKVTRRDGSDFQADLSYGPWHDETGAIAGIMISSVELRDEQGFRASDRSEDRLRSAIELAGLYVWEIDQAGDSTWSAGPIETFFEDASILEKYAIDPWESVHPDDRPAAMALSKERMRRDGRYVAEYRLNRTDKTVWVRFGCLALPSADGGRPRLLLMLQDITERKSAELAAERANEAKSTFLATMSHEIRTPLNGVLGMVQAMSADPLPAEQRGRLEIIRQSGQALLTILNDVLDFSKIEAGKLELEEIEFDLGDVVASVHSTFGAVAGQKGLSFVEDIDAARGVYRGDPARIRQILSNLVSNALKFTEAGELRVAAKTAEGDLELRVSDTGIGIPADKLSSLFTSFTQVDASTSRQFGGTGLGLAICWRLVELLGGAIRVESELGKGSAFIVTLPLVRVAEAGVAAPPSDGKEQQTLGVRVLAAEDNQVNQLVLKALLQQVGVEPVVVDNGALAVEAWEASDWDAILMDMQMPVMDGLAATAAIRGREAATGRRRTPILALTADAMSHQVAKYLAAGMDGHVAKPIDAGSLFNALEAALADVHEPGEAVVSSSAA
jgi:PAS domain S-box-containing protein